MNRDTVSAVSSTFGGILVGLLCGYFWWGLPTAEHGAQDGCKVPDLTGEEIRLIELGRRRIRREKAEAAARELLKSGKVAFQEMPDLATYPGHTPGPPSRYVRIPVEGVNDEIYISRLAPDGTFHGLYRLRR